MGHRANGAWSSLSTRQKPKKGVVQGILGLTGGNSLPQGLLWNSLDAENVKYVSSVHCPGKAVLWKWARTRGDTKDGPFNSLGCVFLCSLSTNVFTATLRGTSQDLRDYLKGSGFGARPSAALSLHYNDASLPPTQVYRPHPSGIFQMGQLGSTYQGSSQYHHPYVSYFH